MSTNKANTKNPFTMAAAVKLDVAPPSQSLQTLILIFDKTFAVNKNSSHSRLVPYNSIVVFFDVDLMKQHNNQLTKAIAFQ